MSWFMSSRGQCSSRKGPVLGEVVGDGARRLARRAGACPLSPSIQGVLGVSSRDVTDRVDRVSAGGCVRGRTRGSRSRLGGFAGVRAFTHTSYERAEKTGTGQEWAMGSGRSHGRGAERADEAEVVRGSEREPPGDGVLRAPGPGRLCRPCDARTWAFRAGVASGEQQCHRSHTVLPHVSFLFKRMCRTWGQKRGKTRPAPSSMGESGRRPACISGTCFGGTAGRQLRGSFLVSSQVHVTSLLCNLIYLFF